MKEEHHFKLNIRKNAHFWKKPLEVFSNNVTKVKMSNYVSLKTSEVGLSEARTKVEQK